ncbi:hypothetical protein GCM10007086_13050 [Photobacterium aphoticum]|nr:hypothetical protein GCM10007086_13050 [Photobacterium aphoticum]
MQRYCKQANKQTSKQEEENDVFEKEHLIKLANVKMPYGKYAGRVIIDLPEEYLLWFQKKGFPEGELGMLMALALEFKIEGLESVIKPLKY